MIVVEMKMGAKDFVRGNDVMAMEEIEVDAAEDGGYGQGEEEDDAAFAFHGVGLIFLILVVAAREEKLFHRCVAVAGLSSASRYCRIICYVIPVTQIPDIFLQTNFSRATRLYQLLIPTQRQQGERASVLLNYCSVMEQATSPSKQVKDPS